MIVTTNAGMKRGCNSIVCDAVHFTKVVKLDKIFNMRLKEKCRESHSKIKSN